jgi:predicted metallo-beta-lactamase superfamily hydrolase
VLKKIKITPLAAESFGVRSMCTLVETQNVTLLLDAGVSLCPYRFHLPPHPIEFKAIDRIRRRIAEAADKADVVTISHYHFDHHTPSYEDWLVNWTELNETARQIYHDKKVLMKNPREKINASQRQRAWLFQKTGGKYAKSLETADNKAFTFGDGTVLRFSEAVPHGPDDTTLGWVVMALVECGDERFMFAPDVAQLQLGLRNLTEIVKSVPLTILEHHALREEAWQQRTKRVCDKAAENRHRVMTAAEFMGQDNNFLESKRRKLYVENPPSKEFEKWMRESLKEKSGAKPPI